MWIKREISEQLQKNQDPIQIIRGPRQCGKSSLILRLDPSFQEISLDDPQLRSLAQKDPELLLAQYKNQNLFIDEAQYAPALFPSLKRKVDLLKRDPNFRRKTVIRLTGSNQILMDRNIKESLAGRASFFDMNTLSISEILKANSETKIQDILFLGGWPEIHAANHLDPVKFLNDYINSYIEKDVILSAGIQKSHEFLKLIQLLAGRVGNILDLSNLANEADVDSKTAKEWISILEKMHIVALVPPYFSNLSSRLTKSPKVYFIDTGLACRLQGWTFANPILTSPQQGQLFENLVFSELFKLNINFQLGWKIFHWRSRDGEEIDFLIQKSPTKFFFLESKVSPQLPKSPENFSEVKKVFRTQSPPLYVCHQEGHQIIAGQIPIRHLTAFCLGGN